MNTEVAYGALRTSEDVGPVKTWYAAVRGRPAVAHCIAQHKPNPAWTFDLSSWNLHTGYS